MTDRTLVAGVGNIFLGDDGFGVEVVRRMAGDTFPAGVKVADFGIRGVHLAYELLEGYKTTILVDATHRGGVPGTVYVIEPDLESIPAGVVMDAHSLDPATVFGMLHALGGAAQDVLVVGCEPATIDDGIGLSEPVERAVDEAVRIVRELVAERHDESRKDKEK
jgi:hydrogenase maturation protease